jgi:hypothetical protein
MSSLLRSMRRNWDALLAFFLAWTTVAIYLGPGYYFALLYVLTCLAIARTALRR